MSLDRYSQLLRQPTHALTTQRTVALVQKAINKKIKPTPSGIPTLDELLADLKVEFTDVTERTNKFGIVNSTSRTAARLQAQLKTKRDKFQGYALLHRRRVDHEGFQMSAQLEVNSPFMQTALQEICGDTYYDMDTKSTPIVIRQPYKPLFHYRKQIREYASSKDRDEREKNHMQLLIDFMDRNFADMEEEYDGLLKAKCISGDLIWTLFRPREVVIAQRDHYIECFVVVSAPEYVIELRRWDYNGSRFGPSKHYREVSHFTGIRKISALEVYPIEFYDDFDGASIRDKLIARGRKWRQMVDVSHQAYNGTAWTDPLQGDAQSFGELIPIHISGRIILDYNTHQQARPQLATQLIKSGAMASDEREENKARSPTAQAKKPQEQAAASKTGKHVELIKDEFTSHRNDSSYVITDEQALLAPALVKGFSLDAKAWAIFLVEKATDIEWREDSFSRLEVENEVKKVIQALINSHGKQDTVNGKFNDIVANKGQGLVFLLAGPPGLGKTLTAECVAEKNKMPLYSITSGELGTDVVATDKKLRDIFVRAKTWNAILLLDEADIFLAKRDRFHMQRNGLVSIFLRLIEFYQGIIFLTTNRVSEFDPAFESRIHFKVSYTSLTAAQRTALWRNFLCPLSNRAWDEDILSRLGADLELNGREIKNNITTALALAEDQGTKLAEEHIRTVYTLKTKWEKRIEA